MQPPDFGYADATDRDDTLRAAFAQVRADQPTDLSVPAAPAGATNVQLNRVLIGRVQGPGCG